MRILTISALCVCLLSPVLAQDRPGLQGEADIENSLRIVATVEVLRDNCDALDLRKIKAVMYVRGIQSRARKLGYSDAEIEAYVDDDAQRGRLEGIAMAYLQSKDAVPGDAGSFCAVAKGEMAAKSTVGGLLKGG